MIPADDFDEYARAVDAVTALVRSAVLGLERELGGLPPDELAAAIGKRYHDLVDEYGSYAAACAVEMYERAREAGGVDGGFEPVQYGPDNAAALAWDVSEALGHETLRDSLASLAASSVRRSMEYADETLVRNASDDPARPRYALVPHPGACGWCAMMASNGFVYASEASAARARHPNCRCRPVVDFTDPGVEGHDPSAYQEEYRRARESVEADARRAWADMPGTERERWRAGGRGAFDHYLRNRIASEMDARRRRG